MQGTAKFVLIPIHTVQILQITGIHSVHVHVLYIHVHAMSISRLIVTHIICSWNLFFYCHKWDETNRNEYYKIMMLKKRKYDAVTGTVWEKEWNKQDIQPAKMPVIVQVHRNITL